MGIEVTLSEKNFLEKVCADYSLSSKNFFQGGGGKSNVMQIFVLFSDKMLGGPNVSERLHSKKRSTA